MNSKYETCMPYIPQWDRRADLAPCMILGAALNKDLIHLGIKAEGSLPLPTGEPMSIKTDLGSISTTPGLDKITYELDAKTSEPSTAEQLKKDVLKAWPGGPADLNIKERIVAEPLPPEFEDERKFEDTRFIVRREVAHKDNAKTFKRISNANVRSVYHSIHSPLMEYGFISSSDKIYTTRLRSVLVTECIQRDNEPGWLDLKDHIPKLEATMTAGHFWQDVAKWVDWKAVIQNNGFGGTFAGHVYWLKNRQFNAVF